LKRFLAAALALAVSGPAWPHDNSLQIYQHLTDGKVVGTTSAPSAREAEIKASAVWAHTGTAPTLAGSNGEVMYAFGQSHPVVLCAPLHVCVVKLLDGDVASKDSIAIGDSVRWLVQPTVAGKRTILAIKPTAPGLETNLVVTAENGHVYYLTLISDQAKFVPEVGFYNPGQLWASAQGDAAAAREQEKKKAESVVATLPDINPADMDFEYWVEGPKEYRPIRVFSAAGKVYIQMPANIKYGNAPALFVVENGQEQLANYQMIGPFYVVDQLFGEARLLLGVGSDKQVVTIHAGKKSFW
jgi:type IV secretion system protein VirB9